MPEISLWLLGKAFVILAFGIYVAFAAVVVRQVQLMAKTISVGLEIPIKALVLIHLIIAIFALVFVLVYL